MKRNSTLYNVLLTFCEYKQDFLRFNCLKTIQLCSEIYEPCLYTLNVKREKEKKSNFDVSLIFAKGKCKKK